MKRKMAKEGEGERKVIISRDGENTLVFQTLFIYLFFDVLFRTLLSSL